MGQKREYMEEGEGLLEKLLSFSSFLFSIFRKLSSVSHSWKASPAALGMYGGSRLSRMTPLEGCQRGASEDFDLEAQVCKPKGWCVCVYFG